jgi:transcriptional regulator with XRE-family HTH domain
MDTFAKIVMLLKQKKLTQKDLTDHLGLSRSVFTDWKSGKNTSYIKHIGAISELLGVSTDFLLGKEKSPPSDAHGYITK